MFDVWDTFDPCFVILSDHGAKSGYRFLFIVKTHWFRVLSSTVYPDESCLSVMDCAMAGATYLRACLNKGCHIAYINCPKSRAAFEGVGHLRASVLRPPRFVLIGAHALARAHTTSQMSRPVPSYQLWLIHHFSKGPHNIFHTLDTPRPTTTPGTEPPSTTSKDDMRLVPNFAMPPKVTVVVHTPDVERGTVDFESGWIVLCQRFASRSTSRNLYISTPQEGRQNMVPLEGAWVEASQEEELGLPAKSPMSVVMDREKIIVV